MKALLQILLALLLLAAEAALLRLVGGAVTLALPLAVVVHLALRAENVEGILVAAAVGYLVDVAAGGPTGLLTFLSVLLFLGARFAGATVDVRGWRGFALLVGAGTFAVGLGAFLLTRWVAPAGTEPGGRVLWRILVEAVLTGAAAPAVLWVLRRIDALFEEEEPGLLRGP